jgi:hypothetical protein
MGGFRFGQLDVFNWNTWYRSILSGINEYFYNKYHYEAFLAAVIFSALGIFVYIFFFQYLIPKMFNGIFLYTGLIAVPLFQEWITPAFVPYYTELSADEE